MKSFVLSAILVSSSMAFVAQAATTTLNIEVENIEYQPYYGWDGKAYSGFMRDVVDGFAKKHKYKIEYKALLVARLFRDAINGEVDVKMPDNPNWSAEDKKASKLIYSDAIVSAREAVLVPAAKVKTLKAEDIKKVGKVTGFTAFGILGEIKSGKIKVVENANLSGFLEQVLLGRIDGAYVEGRVAANILRKENWK